MIKKLSLLLVLTLGFAWAQDDDESQRDERLNRKKLEEQQRLDEYANSLRRRDWLKDRLVFEVGLGSKYPVMGETGFGFGFGAEYITRWHVGAFATYGFIPSTQDEAFDNITLDGGTGYRVGLNYYLFPKNPLHLGVSASYGTVYFDHNQKPNSISETGEGTRALIICNGFEFDMTITYLTDQWYFLQFVAGMYYIPKSELDAKSWEQTVEGRKSLVINEDGIPETGLVFGVGIGFALPEFFPDDTEIRRRERERKAKARR